MSASVPASVRYAYRIACARRRRMGDGPGGIWRLGAEHERAIVRMYATGADRYTDEHGTKWGRDGCYKAGPRPWEGLPMVDQTGPLQW